MVRHKTCLAVHVYEFAVGTFCRKEQGIVIMSGTRFLLVLVVQNLKSYTVSYVNCVIICCVAQSISNIYAV